MSLNDLLGVSRTPQPHQFPSLYVLTAVPKMSYARELSEARSDSPTTYANSFVFRVQGLPQGHDDSLQRYVRGLVVKNSHLHNLELDCPVFDFQVDIVTSCYGGPRVALIEFAVGSEVFGSQRHLREFQYYFRRDTGANQLNADCTFSNLTQLYNNPEKITAE